MPWSKEFMPAAPDFVEFHTLYSSPIVTVSKFCCRANRSGPGEEELSEANRVVLMRRGAFSKHLGRKKITADVNQAVFFAKGRKASRKSIREIGRNLIARRSTRDR